MNRVLKFSVLIFFSISGFMKAASFESLPEEMKRIICDTTDTQSLGQFRLASKPYSKILDSYAQSHPAEIRGLLLHSSPVRFVNNEIDFNFIVQRESRLNISDDVLAGFCQKVIAVKKSDVSIHGHIALAESIFSCVSRPYDYQRSLEHLIESYKIKALKVIVDAHFPVNLSTDHFAFDSIEHVNWLKRNMLLEKRDEHKQLDVVKEIIEEGSGIYQNKFLSLLPSFIVKPVDQNNDLFLINRNCISAMFFQNQNVKNKQSAPAVCSIL